MRLGLYHPRSQDFVGGPGRHHTFEADACNWGSVSAPAVSRVMGGAPKIGEMTFFCFCFVVNHCCQPKIHWYDAHKCR